nr:hypothetical protein [Tanacetum cinerariifolium]
MYYPRFTKVIINHFMSKDPSIPRRNKFGALLPIELTNKEIRNFNAYKEYYAIVIGVAPPKTKASVRRTKSSSDTSTTPPTAAAGPRLTSSQKGKQAAKATKAKSINEGTGSIPGVPDAPTNESEEELFWNSTDDEGADDEGKDGDDDEEDDGDDGEEGDSDDDDEKMMVKEEYDDDESDEETRDEESFDPILQTPKNSDDEGNGEEDFGLNVSGEEGHVEEEDEVYRDVNINQGRGIQASLQVEDSHVTLTLVNPDCDTREIFKF